MSEALSRRLKQTQFANPAQEALLSVIVAANTLNVLRILRGVHPEGHARSEIACRMVDRASDITRLVDRLQTRGLVKRYRGDSDQRQTVTYITPKGTKLLDKMRPQIDAQTATILRRLSEENCRELGRLCALIFEPELESQSTP